MLQQLMLVSYQKYMKLQRKGTKKINYFLFPNNQVNGISQQCLNFTQLILVWLILLLTIHRITPNYYILNLKSIHLSNIIINISIYLMEFWRIYSVKSSVHDKNIIKKCNVQCGFIDRNIELKQLQSHFQVQFLLDLSYMWEISYIYKY